MPVEVSGKQGAGKLFPMLKVWGDRPGHPAVALNRPVCLVGRRGMHLSLESPTVSRTHALIINDARRVYIRDLASRNGTSVNGALVHEAELAETAVVRIGSYALRCETGFPKSPDDVPAPQAPPVELHVDGHAVPIPPGQKTVLIGRREGCEIQLVDEDASPVHAVVFELAGKHHVRDLNSENGTFVNGQPTRQAELREGDELRIGRTKIRYTHAGGNGVATGDAEVDLDALEAIDVESVEEQRAAVEMPRTLDDVLQEALAVPDAPIVEEDASLDVEIDPEDIDDQPDFGSTALESNLEQLAAGPLPRRPMGELDEPELDEIDVDAPDAPMADLEAAFVDVEPADEGIPRDEKPPVQAAAPSAVAEARNEVAPQTLTAEPAPSTAPAPSSAPASTAAPAATVEPIAPPAAQAPAKEPPDTLGPLAGDGPDALSDAAPAVAVNSDQLVDNVDASTGPIAIADDDDVLDIVMDDDDNDDAVAAPPEASTSPADSTAAEVLDEPAEVVDGKV